ncbi:MAG: NAD(P)-dependent alcohol dehydrogenase [Promethearchaeota archaeon]
MKAVVCRRFGPPEVLQTKMIDKPIPKDNEVLVKIHAATVTKFDCWIRSSSRMFRFLMRLATGIRFPKDTLLGTELAGEIEAVGKDVVLFNIGDQVFAFLGMRMGAYAEYICLQEESVMATKPINMTFDEAAAVQQGALSALYFLRMTNIQRGQKILIYGASGGVGLFTVQLAKYFGAEVTGVCSTTKIDLVKSMGADKIVDYKKEDFTKSGEIYDIIFDTIGTSPFSGSVRSLKDGGIYLFVTYGILRSIRARVHNLTSSKKTVSKIIEETTDDLLFIKNLIEEGKLRVAIDRRFPLDQAAQAHRYVETGRKKGNVIITIVDS